MADFPVGRCNLDGFPRQLTQLLILEVKKGEQMRKRVFCPVLIQSDLRSRTGQTQRVQSGRPGRRSEQQTGTIAGSRRAAAVLKALSAWLTGAPVTYIVPKQFFSSSAHAAC